MSITLRASIKILSVIGGIVLIPLPIFIVMGDLQVFVDLLLAVLCVITVIAGILLLIETGRDYRLDRASQVKFRP